MIDLLPEVPFNPVTAYEAIRPDELIAGPFGLLLFMPLIPLVRLAARRWPHGALLGFSLLWLIATLGPAGCAVFIGAALAGSAWVVILGHLRRRQQLGRRQMIALTWIGLHLLMLPLWWVATWSWYGWGPSRLAALHPIGLSYILLRLLAWGVDWAANPPDRLRLRDTLCWLFYPPGLRNSPFLLRASFLTRLSDWNPRAAIPATPVLKQAGWGLLGLIGLAVCMKNIPRVIAPGEDYFARPDAYDTNQLVCVAYLLPIMVYLFLWTYNQIALTASLWLGIPVDTNFQRLPLATSVREFWRRWNISVGLWVRDYIYIPLGGNRAFAPLVFLACFGYCGVWHGAAWSFVAWAVTQAAALTVQRGWDGYRKRRGWDTRPSSRAWLVCCWILTVHYQLLTVLVFADFRHFGVRLYGELWSRLWAVIS